MKNLLFYTLFAFAFVSCSDMNLEGSKTITNDGDTLAEADISLSKLDAIEALSEIDEPKEDKILFKASGSEPGWIAEISQLKIRLLFNYGEDSLILDNKGAVINEKEDYNYIIDGKISISALNKPCTDESSGEKMERQVVIAYKGKKHTGCGKFLK